MIKKKKRKEKGEGRPKEEKKKKPRRLPTERRVNAEKVRKIIEGDNCLIVPEVFINFFKNNNNNNNKTLILNHTLT